jgi:phosphopantetheinyl transferase (holo-ACP synthase)
LLGLTTLGIGRLLIRKLMRELLHVADDDAIHLLRSSMNKPYLDLSRVPPEKLELVRGWNFNVSHSGAWAVLAASNTRLVGVDVQRVEISGVDKNEERFFEQLQSVFHATEWRSIRGTATNHLTNFFHFWTLKESYIKVCHARLTARCVAQLIHSMLSKAVGVGLHLELERIQLHLPNDSRALGLAPQRDGDIQLLDHRATIEVDRRALVRCLLLRACTDARTETDFTPLSD